LKRNPEPLVELDMTFRRLPWSRRAQWHCSSCQPTNASSFAASKPRRHLERSLLFMADLVFNHLGLALDPTAAGLSLLGICVRVAMMLSRFAPADWQPRLARLESALTAFAGAMCITQVSVVSAGSEHLLAVLLHLALSAVAAGLLAAIVGAVIHHNFYPQNDSGSSTLAS
jgi:hypothetical protein